MATATPTLAPPVTFDYLIDTERYGTAPFMLVSENRSDNQSFLHHSDEDIDYYDALILHKQYRMILANTVNKKTKKMMLTVMIDTPTIRAGEHIPMPLIRTTKALYEQKNCKPKLQVESWHYGASADYALMIAETWQTAHEAGQIFDSFMNNPNVRDFLKLSN